MAERLDPSIVREYAKIFSDVLKSGGVLTGLGGDTTGDSLRRFRIEEAREEAMGRSNQVLKEYIKTQEELNTGTGDTLELEKRRGKLEEKLQKDSILLGDSFTSAANAIKEGRLKPDDLKDFISDESKNKLNQSFDEVSDNIEEGGLSVRSELKNLGNKIKLESTAFIGRIFSGALFINAFKKAEDDLEAALKFGTDLTQNLWERVTSAAQLGLAPAQLTELEARNRRLVNAMGGAAAFQEQLVDTSHAYILATGNLEESTRFSAQVLKALNLASADATNALIDAEGNITGIGKTFDSIRAQTGETFAEQAAALEEYTRSEVGRTRLVSANTKAERRSVIQRELGTRLLLRNMGLTAEQADRVSDAFKGITGLDPKERFRESFKAQAIAGALGIENAHLIQKAIAAGGAAQLEDADERREATIALGKLSKEQAEAMTGNFLEANNAMVSGLFRSSGALAGFVQQFRDVQLRDEEAAKRAREIAEEGVTGITDEKPILLTGITEAFKGKELIESFATNHMLLGGIAGGVTGILGFIAANSKLFPAMAAGIKSFVPKIGTVVGKSLSGGIKGLVPKIGTVVGKSLSGGLAPLLVKGGIIGTAVFAVTDAVRAMITGQSASFDTIEKLAGEEKTANIADEVGKTIDGLLVAFTGNEDAKRRLELKEQADRLESANIKEKRKSPAAAIEDKKIDTKRAGTDKKQMDLQREFITGQNKLSSTLAQKLDMLQGSLEKLISNVEKQNRSNDLMRGIQEEQLTLLERSPLLFENDIEQ